MKGVTQIVLAVVIFILGLLLGISLGSRDFPLGVAWASLATLLAAFLGAWFAFQLQNKKQEKDERKGQIDAVNRAIYMIYDMWNVLFQYKEEVINPVRGKPDDWLNMSASLEGQFHEVSFSAKELVFLLSTKYADLYSRLLLEEQRFTIAMGLIRTRSRLVYEQLHPKMEQLGFKVGEPIELYAFENSLGPDLTNKLKQLTNGIMSNVDEDVTSLRVLYDDFRKSMKTYFEINYLLKVEFQSNSS